MPACNIYNEENQLLLVKFFDTVTAADMEEQAVLLADNPKEGAARLKCISFLSTTDFGPGITLDKVRSAAGKIQASLTAGSKTKTALVAPDEETLGVALMFQDCLQAGRSPGEVRVFTTKDEAIDWLGGSREQWKQMREHVARMCSL
jgi:hypothetical protein